MRLPRRQVNRPTPGASPTTAGSISQSAPLNASTNGRYRRVFSHLFDGVLSDGNLYPSPRRISSRWSTLCVVSQHIEGTT